ncbi:MULTISPECIES: hypothetical protein [unclassified Streptomyces]|uniref:hypothetical protein n=1 Tax=unclassified Streptomyces TaxID=2593676 RepID=UPI00381A5E41
MSTLNHDLRTAPHPDRDTLAAFLRGTARILAHPAIRDVPERDHADDEEYPHIVRSVN